MHSLAKKLAIAKYTNNNETFKKDEFPSLKDISIKVVSKNFNQYPELRGASQEVQQTIVSKTTTNWKELPPSLTAPYISEESYWKRACENRWKNSQKTINLEDHGKSWKVAYLEKHIEDFLGNLQVSGGKSKDKDNSQEQELSKLIIQELASVRPWIHSLNITHMKAPLDICIICEHLPLLTNLNITYGMKNPGMDYTRQCLGMKLSEAANLGFAVEKSFNLLSLSLPANMIDDDLSKFIMSGVSHNISLIELNLSHNKLGTESARRIAKFLMRNELLQYLDLSNNQIDYDGSRYLAQSLKVNQTLTHLNLRLNCLDDTAGSKFFKDLVFNRTLVELNASGNKFGYKTAVKLSEYLGAPCTLKALFIGNNNFGDDCFEILKSGLTQNLNLQRFDIRGCKFTKQRDKDGQVKNDFKQSESEKILQEITLHKYFADQKLHFVYEEEYLEKKFKMEEDIKIKLKLQEENSKKNEKGKD